MTDKLPQTRVAIKVPFFDIDPMHVVWHGHYIKYFELARCELLAGIDYGYCQMEESGWLWPVIELQVRYVKSATLGQSIYCTARIVEYENRLKIAYEVHCAVSGERLTRGHSVQVAVNKTTREMSLVSPQILFDRLGLR